MGSTLTSILTSMTTITGLFSVFYEMRKSANVAESNFILELFKNFNDSQAIQEAYEKLDKLFTEDKNTVINSDDRSIIERYLSYIEMLADLINRDTLSIKDVDQVFGYPFFLVTNNLQSQSLELKKYPEYYQNIYSIYPKWKKYRQKRNMPIPFSKTPLI